MPKFVHVSHQGSITIKEYPTLSQARYQVRMLSDRHLTQQEIQDRKK